MCIRYRRVVHYGAASRYEFGVRVDYIPGVSKAEATWSAAGYTGSTVDNIVSDSPRDGPRHRVHEPLIWLVANIILN